MPELNRVPPELMARFARAQHRRQILAALPAAGLAVATTPDPDRYHVTDAEARRAELRFVPNGAIEVIGADGRATRRWFDPEGRLARVVDPAGVEARFAYLGGETTIERSDGTRFAIRQDPFGLPESVAFPDGSASSIDWDAEGGEVITDRAGNRAQRLRDEAGKQVGAIDPRGQRHAYRASAEGAAAGFLEHISPSGRVDRYELDDTGGLAGWWVNGSQVARARGTALPGIPARIEYRDGRWAEYAVKDGRIVAARGSGGEVRLTHDDAGRLVEDNQNGAAVRYARDRTGLLTGIAFPDGGRVGFGYDEAGLLASVTDWDGLTTRVRWSTSGQLAGLLHPNGVASAIKSDPLARIVALDVAAPDGAALHQGRYAYDVLDRLVSATEDGVDRQYTYDGVDRLTSARATDRALDESWTLDALGNRVVDNGRAFVADPDNRVSGQGSAAIAWDALGRAAELELPNGRRGRLTHDGRGQLTRIDFAGGGTAEYGYDAFGRRAWKRVDGRTTRYLWAGPTLASEVRDAGPGWTRRDHLFLPDLYYPVAMRVDGRTVRLHCDRRGAVVAATGPDGGVVWRARLKAFGEALVDVGTIDQPWRLANQYCDEESGLHYNLARHYHPGLGRYLSQDPLLDPATRGNWYQYAAGDPLGRADPTGEFVIPAILIAVAVGAAVGAAIGAGIKAYETPGQDWNADRWKEIGKGALIGGVVGAVGGATGAALTAAAGAGAGALTAIMAIGAVEGAVTSVVQDCAEAAAYDRALSAGDVLQNLLVGAGIGAFTAGVGGLIARRLAKAKIRPPHELDGVIGKQPVNSGTLDQMVKSGELTVAEAREVAKRSAFKDASGQPIYPPKEGFSSSKKSSIKAGQTVDRFGGYVDETGQFKDRGKFFGDAGADYSGRALPPGTDSKPKRTYKVLKDIPCEEGPATPWFDEPGGGNQYKSDLSVDELIEQGYLAPLD